MQFQFIQYQGSGRLKWGLWTEMTPTRAVFILVDLRLFRV